MFGAGNRRETRSMLEKVSMTPGAKGLTDHSYNTPSSKAPQSDKCNGCKKIYERQQKRIECGFCESDFCNHCSGLNKSTFEALSSCESASWYCPHCVFAVPGVKKLLIRVGNIEDKCESLNERVQSLENKEQVSSDSVKGLIQEEISELKEIESRKLNIVCLNLPESRKTDMSERRQEDMDLLKNVMENRMNLNPDVINVNKLVRLGRREATDETIKPRPMRFTVNLFDHKRQILKANSLLRNSEDDIFSNVYFTPDLTKNQRKAAYELRVERRSREAKGESNLKINKGKIVVKKNGNNVESGSFVEGTAGSSGPSGSD